MDNDGMQTGFGATGAGVSEVGASQAETAPSVSSAETSSIESSATGNEGGLPPTATQPVADKNLLASSEKGSFELRYNEKTGRNEVVSTMPEAPEEQEQEQEQAEEQQTVQTGETSYAGDELLSFLNKQNAQQPQPQQNMQAVPPNTTAEYTLQELQTAMQAGQIDEARIPVMLRPGYYAAMAQAQQQQKEAQQQQKTQNQQTETAKAQEFYRKVQDMARERAMKEVGITQDDIDVAEYTDDQEILNKFNAYQVALENNRAKILQDVSNVQREQQAVAADRSQAYNAISAFVQEMKQKEPNFDAIDKLMITRVAKMPHEQAVKVEPLIRKVQNGTLTTADLPALQDMYNQTRLEFYSNKTGVSLAPKVAKPAYVETPGNGASAPRKTTPLSALGTMSKRDKEAAIGQMFASFFDE